MSVVSALVSEGFYVEVVEKVSSVPNGCTDLTAEWSSVCDDVEASALVSRSVVVCCTIAVVDCAPVSSEILDK